MNRRQVYTLSLAGLVLACILSAKILIQYSTISGSDFTQDYSASSALKNGVSIYDNWNDHPPFVAIAFYPLTLFSEHTAFLVLGVASLLLHLNACFLLGRCLQLGRLWVLIAAASMLWLPFLGSLGLGALSLVISSLLIFGWVAVQKNQEDWAGIFFSLATAMKLFPGLIFLYLVVTKRRRATFSFLMSSLTLSLICIMAVGWNDCVKYFTAVAPANLSKFAPFIANLSLTGLLVRFFGYPNEWISPLWSVGTQILQVASILNCVFVLWLYGQCRKLQQLSDADNSIFSLVCIGMLIASPITWAHSFVLLIPGFALLLRNHIQNPQSVSRATLLALYLSVSQADTTYILHKARALAPNLLPWYYSNIALVSQIGMVWLAATIIQQAQRQRTGVESS